MKLHTNKASERVQIEKVIRDLLRIDSTSIDVQRDSITLCSDYVDGRPQTFVTIRPGVRVDKRGRLAVMFVVEVT